MLDEQSFQDMLEAAFTIQEHNAKRRRTLQPQPACSRCGEPVQEGERLCRRCAGDEPRPGEKLQQKWASMWLKGQEQGLWPEGARVERQDVEEVLRPIPVSDVAAPVQEDIEPAPDSQDEPEWSIATIDDPQIRIVDIPETENLELASSEPVEDALDTVVEAPVRDRVGDLQLTLRFHRADFYLVVAIVVSTFAMFWVLLATPTPDAQRKPRLRPWERAMVSLGLAEAPEPPPQTGNPAAQVWVDPKTALYYCLGDEQFSKTAGGYSTTQRDARLNAFQPAGRAPCD